MRRVLSLSLLLIAIVCCFNFSYSDDVDGVKKEGNRVNIELIQEKLVVEFMNNENQNDYMVTFDYGGVNEIYGIDYIEYCNIVGSCLKEEFLETYAETDWLGPYVVSEVNSEMTNKFFTGGWHQNPKDKSSTAKTESIKFFIADKIVSDGRYEAIDTLEIHVTNLVKGHNSSDYILKENIIYSIKNNEINISVTIEALVDICINKYYGLQTYNKLWQGDMNYIKLNDNIRTIHLESKDGSRSMDAIMLGSNLGTFEYKSESLDSAFSEDYGKSYFNLINGKLLKLGKGEHVLWKGLYRIN